MINFHKEAHSYIGVPFIHRGRTRRGLDCVGLVILAAKDCGYKRYREFAYGREPRSTVLESVLNEHFGEPIDDKPAVNDVVLMQLKPNAAPSHIGIITTHPDGLGIIHAYGSVNRVVYHRLTEKVRSKITGVYRWPAKY